MSNIHCVNSLNFSALTECLSLMRFWCLSQKVSKQCCDVTKHDCMYSWWWPSAVTVQHCLTSHFHDITALFEVFYETNKNQNLKAFSLPIALIIGTLANSISWKFCWYFPIHASFDVSIWDHCDVTRESLSEITTSYHRVITKVLLTRVTC